MAEKMKGWFFHMNYLTPKYWYGNGVREQVANGADVFSGVHTHAGMRRALGTINQNFRCYLGGRVAQMYGVFLG